MRRLSKVDVERLRQQTGVRVRYAEEEKSVQAEPREVTLTVPENLLQPLLDVIEGLFLAQKETQKGIEKALNRLTGNTTINVEITERDGEGNIKNLCFNKLAPAKPVRH